MFRNPIAQLVVAAVLLTGCSGLTPSGAVAVARLDPLETSPSDIAVAVSVPEALRLKDGDAVFALGFVTDDPAVAKAVTAKVPLKVSTGATGPTGAAGAAVYVFEFSSASAAQVAAVQSQIKALKARDVAGKGTLSVTLEGGCLLAPLGETLLVSMWLRQEAQTGFVPLSQGSDLFAALPERERVKLKANLLPC